MTDWETRMSERATVRHRRALAEERAEIPPIRQYEIPLGEVVFWSALIDPVHGNLETVNYGGKTYRIIP